MVRMTGNFVLGDIFTSQDGLWKMPDSLPDGFGYIFRLRGRPFCIRMQTPVYPDDDDSRPFLWNTVVLCIQNIFVHFKTRITKKFFEMLITCPVFFPKEARNVFKDEKRQRLPVVQLFQQSRILFR